MTAEGLQEMRWPLERSALDKQGCYALVSGTAHPNGLHWVSHVPGYTYGITSNLVSVFMAEMPLAFCNVSIASFAVTSN